MTLNGEHKEIMNIACRIPWILQHMPRSSRTDVGHFWDLVLRKVVRNSCQQAKWWMEQNCWSHDAQLCWEPASCISFHRRYRKRIIKKQRGWKEVHSLQLKWRNRWINSSHCYFRQSPQYLRSSRRFLQRIRSRIKKSNWRWDLWIFGGTGWDPNANAASLSSTSLKRRTCCKNTNGNSQNFLMIRNCRNCAPTLVSPRKLGLDHSSLQLKRDRRLCRQHFGNTQNLEIWKHPDREGGFVRTRKSAQSWMWKSILMKYIIVLISWFESFV